MFYVTECHSFHFSGLECGKLTDYLSKEEVVKALKTPLASKQYGNEDFLADLVAEACSKSSPPLLPFTGSVPLKM